ncbi:MAG: glycosyltransferase [Pseudomonadota bacterium]
MKALGVLATDQGFIVPSLVVARQVRFHQCDVAPDLKIYLSDFTDEEFEIVRPIGDRYDVEFVRVSTDILKVDEKLVAHFDRGISPTALMRLAIADILPDHYDNIVYLDGDMQILGTLDPLFGTAPPEDRIAAAPETYVILREKDGSPRQWVLDYLDTLGLEKETQYFNSGMLSFRLPVWKELAPKALSFFRDNADICPNYDQCALNAVLGGDWAPIHPAFNWNSHFNKLVGEPGFDPRIVHFTSRPKPWSEGQHEWAPRYYGPYADILAQHPELSRFLNVRSAPGLMDQARHIKHTVAGWNKSLRYKRWIAQYAATQDFHVTP